MKLHAKTQSKAIWGTISGTFIIRKNAVVTPDSPPHTHCIMSESNPNVIETVAIETGIQNSELLCAVKYANKLFDTFELTGDSEFQATIGIMACAHGVGLKIPNIFSNFDHKDMVRNTPELQAEKVCTDQLSESQLNDLAKALQEAGILHRLSVEMQSRSFGLDQAFERFRAILALTKDMGLHADVDQSKLRAINLSIEICALQSDIQPVTVRFGGPDKVNFDSLNQNYLDINFNDGIEAALLQLRSQLRNQFDPATLNLPPLESIVYTINHKRVSILDDDERKQFAEIIAKKAKYFTGCTVSIEFSSAASSYTAKKTLKRNAFFQATLNRLNYLTEKQFEIHPAFIE